MRAPVARGIEPAAYHAPPSGVSVTRAPAPSPAPSRPSPRPKGRMVREVRGHHLRPMTDQRTGYGAMLVLLGFFACTATAKQQGIDQVLGSMSAEQRRDNFQQTAAVLDQHPEWVDQFY